MSLTNLKCERCGATALIKDFLRPECPNCGNWPTKEQVEKESLAVRLADVETKLDELIDKLKKGGVIK